MHVMSLTLEARARVSHTSSSMPSPSASAALLWVWSAACRPEKVVHMAVGWGGKMNPGDDTSQGSQQVESRRG